MDSNPTTSIGRAWWGVVLALTLVLAGTFGEALFGKASIAGSACFPYVAGIAAQRGLPPTPFISTMFADQSPVYYHQVLDSLILEDYRAGQLPLWQPYNAFGYPLLGNGQSAPFNPLKLLLWNGAVGHAEAWYLVLRLWLAGLGTLLLARSFGLGPVGGTLATLAFALNGYFLYHLQFSDTSVYFFLPWLVLAGERLAARPSASTLAVAGLFIGLTGMLGHPEAALWSAFAATLAYASAALTRPTGKALALGAWAGAALIGMALSAVVILPFLEYVKLSQSYILDRESSAFGIYFASLHFPNTFITAARNLLSASAMPDPYHYNAFVGVVALVFAGCGLERSPVRRPGLALVGAMVLGYLVCPPGNLLPAPPLAPNSFYAGAVGALGFALLAGAGLERFLREPRARLWTFVVGGLALAATAAFFQERRLEAFFMAHGQSLHGPAYWSFVVTAGLLGGLLLLPRFVARPRWALPVALLTLAAAELIVAARIAVPPLAANDYPPTVLTQAVSPHPGDFRIAGDVQAFPPLTNAMYHFEALGIFDPFIPRRFRAYYEAMCGPTGPIGIDHGLEPTFAPALLDLANVRYVFASKIAPRLELRLAAQPERFPVVARGIGATLHLNTGALSRARVVYGADFVRQDELVTAAARLAWGGERWRDHALLETYDGRPPADWRPVAAPPTPAMVIDWQPTQVTIEARAVAPGWLVLADAYYPGWEASLDGLAVPIYAADVAFRAVRLPVGAHRVVFHYRPRPLVVGGAITLVTLASCLVLLVLPLGGFRRRGARVVALEEDV
jgi:hypothetical protein